MEITITKMSVTLPGLGTVRGPKAATLHRLESGQVLLVVDGRASEPMDVNRVAQVAVFRSIDVLYA